MVDMSGLSRDIVDNFFKLGGLNNEDYSAVNYANNLGNYLI